MICATCGYDLRLLPRQRCPECGAPPAARPRRRSRLLIAGVLLVALGVLVLVIVEFRAGAKPNALYLFGHWIDLEWQLAAPMIAGGAVLSLVGAVCRRRRRAVMAHQVATNTNERAVAEHH